MAWAGDPPRPPKPGRSCPADRRSAAGLVRNPRSMFTTSRRNVLHRSSPQAIDSLLESNCETQPATRGRPVGRPPKTRKFVGSKFLDRSLLTAPPQDRFDCPFPQFTFSDSLATKARWVRQAGAGIARAWPTQRACVVLGSRRPFGWYINVAGRRPDDRRPADAIDFGLLPPMERRSAAGCLLGDAFHRRRTAAA